MRNESDLMCPVCGYADLSEPAYDDDGCASFEICPSCGTEFGYDDANKSVETLRQEWLAGGARRWSKEVHLPVDWSGVKQLEESGLPNHPLRYGSSAESVGGF